MFIDNCAVKATQNGINATITLLINSINILHLHMLKYIFILLLTISLSPNVSAQHLKPGFDKQEFVELLKIGARTSTNAGFYNKLPAPQRSTLIYQSENIGFDNLWQLWRRDDGVGIISIRGTTKTSVSFLANLYAAMVPAKGNMELEKDYTFNYNLSNDPKAAVHVGFLIATAYLARDILPKIDSGYKAGIHEFIITGHSQGGAITYSLTSYMDQLQKEGRLPKDIRFKTYAAASPKPGNLFYAYSFEELTKDGWAYNVVNTVDWVPEVPMSIQTLNDFNVTNPFINAKKLVKKQKFPLNLVLLHAYNQLSKPAKKAQRHYEKWLGKRVSKFVKKSLKDFSAPEYFSSNNYVRTGTTIVLTPDSSYYEKFPEIKDSIWHNHTQVPYLFLMDKLMANEHAGTQPVPSKELNGTWVLDYIAGQNISLDSLFPQKKPTLIFNVNDMQLSGNTGCNSLSGKLEATENKINFNGPIAMTKMACPGNGEMIFLNTLRTINSYSVSGNSLTLIKDDIAEMRFVKIN